MSTPCDIDIYHLDDSWDSEEGDGAGGKEVFFVYSRRVAEMALGHVIYTWSFNCQSTDTVFQLKT
jgi:hypothetical protein